MHLLLPLIIFLLRPGGVLVTPKRSADAVKEDIRSCSQFYFLHSIRVEELKTERTIIPVKEDYLQSLVTREVMTDDYDSHDKIIPHQAFAYNSRLNLSGVKSSCFKVSMVFFIQLFGRICCSLVRCATNNY